MERIWVHWAWAFCIRTDRHLGGLFAEYMIAIVSTRIKESFKRMWLGSCMAREEVASVKVHVRAAVDFQRCFRLLWTVIVCHRLGAFGRVLCHFLGVAVVAQYAPEAHPRTA